MNRAWLLDRSARRRRPRSSAGAFVRLRDGHSATLLQRGSTRAAAAVRRVEQLRVPATLRRGLPRTPVGWALWLLGIVAVMSTPWAWADPALVALALDPELLTMVAAVGLALARDDVREWLVGLRRRCLRRIRAAAARTDRV